MGRRAPSQPPAAPRDPTDPGASQQRLRAQRDPRREPTGPFTAPTTQLGMPPVTPGQLPPGVAPPGRAGAPPPPIPPRGRPGDDSTKRFDLPGGASKAPTPPVPVPPTPSPVAGFGRENTAAMQLSPELRVGRPPAPPAPMDPGGGPGPSARQQAGPGPDDGLGFESPRDTIQTEVPDVPPEVFETYERSLTEELPSSELQSVPGDPLPDAADRPTDLDPIPAGQSAEPEAAGGPELAGGAAATRTSDLDDLAIEPLSSLHPEALAGPAVIEAPSMIPGRLDDGVGEPDAMSGYGGLAEAAGDTDAPPALADGEASTLPPDDDAIELPVARSRPRTARGVRLSFAAAALGGIVALGAGAGLFLLVSALTGGTGGSVGRSAPSSAAATTTAAPPTHLAVDDPEAEEGTAADGEEGTAGQDAGDDDETAPPRTRQPTGETAQAEARDDPRGSPQGGAEADGPAGVPANQADKTNARSEGSEEEDAETPFRDEPASDRMVAEGRQAFRRGERDEAIALFEQALELDRWNPRAAAWLARTHLAREAHGEAERWIDRAIELRPRRASYQRLRAEILEASGRTAAAEAARQDAADLER